MRPERTRLTFLVASAASLGAIFFLLCLAFIWQVWIPPTGGALNIMPSPFPIVPPDQNSAPGYLKAAETLPKREPPLCTLTAQDASVLATPEARKYHNESLAALMELRRSAELPRCEFFSAPSDIESVRGKLLLFRRLGQVAVAEGCRLELSGQPDRACALYSDVIRLGSDISNERAGIFFAMIGISIETLGLHPLYLSLGGKKTSVRGWRRMISRLVALEKAEIGPVATLYGERDNSLRMAGMLVFGSGNSASGGSKRTVRDPLEFPGLRTRAFNSYVKHTMAFYDELKPAAEAWRIDEVSLIGDRREKSFGLWPHDLFARQIFLAVTPNLSRALWQLLISYSNHRAALSLACVHLYYLEKGEYPRTLEEAARYSGLPSAPLDPATGNPVGYRLENNKPVVWCGGPDLKDDGGTKPVTEVFHAPPGTDLVFRLGELPLYWRRAK